MSEIESLLQDEIRSALDPQFNGMLIGAFGCGIYTLIVSQTICKFYLRKRNLLYCFPLIILWIINVVSSTSGWIQNRNAFVSNNSLPLLIVIYAVIAPPSAYIPSTIALGISDAIIMWRCCILWQSKLIFGMLITLLCAMISLQICTNVFIMTPAAGLIQALSMLLSFTTTALATSLIALKIYLATRQTQRYYCYTKIIEILVQSAAILSIIQLGLAILSLMDFVQQFDLTTTRGNAGYQLIEYLVNIQGPISGIAPTLIALCVMEEGSKPESGSTIRSTPPSKLTFRRATHSTASV